MLTRIGAANFGAIGPRVTSCDLSRVTVLVGPNGAGKTTLLRVPVLLAQTAADRSRFGLVHQGPHTHVRYADRRDIWFGRDVGRDVELHVGLEGSEDEHRRFLEEAIGTVRPPTTIEYSLKMRWVRDDWPSTQSLVADGVSVRSEFVVEGQAIRRELVLPGVPRTRPVDDARYVLSPRAFLAHDAPPGGDASRFAVAASVVAGFLTRNTRWVDALRGAETYQPSPTTDTVDRAGRHGRHVLRWIAQMSGAEPALHDRLVRWLDKLGLARLRVSPEGERLRALFDDAASGRRLDLYLAGHGHQQVVALLAELAFAPPGAVVLVEEPETGLHPEGQIALAGIVAEAALERSIQVAVSTHSPGFALAFCRLVRTGSMKPADLALWQVTRDKEGTSAQRLEVDRHGIVHPRWFTTFARAEADLLRDFAEPVTDGEKKKSRIARPRPAGRGR